MGKKYGDVGILTFHCSDNFGAMLQACGLKHFLRRCGIRADIIPYAPPYMTGRHWLIPYVPASGPLCFWIAEESAQKAHTWSAAGKYEAVPDRVPA